MTSSLVYRNLCIYRLTMNLLEGGRYRANTRKIARLFDQRERSVLELCFGDTIIAEDCRAAGRSWIGLDVNPAFVANARRLGFDARQTDLTATPVLPRADLCVMSRSAYHFSADFESLLRRMLAAARRVILMEGLDGLSSRPGPVGWLARRATNAGKGPESFRFTRESLLATLSALAPRVGFRWEIAAESPHELVVILRHD